MKLKSVLLGMLITISTLSFGISNTVKAEDGNINTITQQLNGEISVEIQWINGVLWIIVYDSDGNIIQASAVGHSG
ncbi:MAG: hypothetical protein WCK13_01515 [Ignavibacteriota bacterium]|nr:hypothetical protein [Ignavibacteriota bacterium]